MHATNGDIVLIGTSGTIALTYTAAYAYYNYENERELQAAEEKRVALAAKAKKPKTSTNTGTDEGDEGSNVKKGKERDSKNAVASAKQKGGDDVGSVSPRATNQKRRLGGLLFWRK